MVRIFIRSNYLSIDRIVKTMCECESKAWHEKDNMKNA
ncbi:hypothetical protein B0H35_000002 [Clostridium acetobutylicum]|nr:hypothetical protein [Clostridium acetobutylicum]